MATLRSWLPSAHFWVSLFVVALLALAWVFIPVAFDLQGYEVTIWNACMVVVVITLMVPSLHVLRPDRMIVATFTGDIYEVYAKTKDANPGILGTGIVLIFPPYLARGYVLPLTVVNVPLVNLGAITKDETSTGGYPSTPVTVFIGVQFRLATNLEGLREFLRAFEILRSDRWDLTVPHELEFFKRMNPDGEPEVQTLEVPCIAKELQKALQAVIGEGVSRAIANHSLQAALTDRKQIESDIRNQFVGTVLDQAKMLKPVLHPEHSCTLFDFNIDGVVPSDVSTALALSAQTRKMKEAEGVVAEANGRKRARKLEGEGEASFLQEVASRVATPAGQLVYQGEVLKKLPTNVTIVTNPNNLLNAAAAKVVQQPPPPNQPPTTP